tara:strand:+ start:197 stop:622 length:426 start_codon:yes stop_codon:yes gene_type:complete
MSASEKIDNTLNNLEIELNSAVTNTVEGLRKTKRRVSTVAEELKNFLLKKYPNGFSLEIIMDVVIDSIRYLKRITEMSGHQKRQAITDALLLLLDETNSGELEFFEPIIKSMVPSTVNTLIDVEKKKIKLNKKIKACCICC